MTPQEYIDQFNEAVRKKQVLESTVLVTKQKLDNLLQEQSLIEATKVALEESRPLLSQSSIKQLEALANSAMSQIFHMDAVIQWDPESQRFLLVENTEYGPQASDLVSANGGGVNTVISFLFDLYLLVKSGKRRFLVYDEAFTAISTQYFDDFVAFLKQAIQDLGVDLLLVSHDERMTVDLADTAYVIKDGVSKRLK